MYKKILFLLITMLFLSFGLIYAQSNTANTFGNTTFYNFSDGTVGTANTFGDTTFFNFSDGTSGTANYNFDN